MRSPGSRSLETAIKSHDNSFNLVRLLAALMVVVYHVWPQNTFTPNTPDRLSAWFAPVSNLGTIAIGVFFMVSGLFVTQSWVRDPHVVRFAVRRVARIVPGLFFCLLLTTVCAVIFFSDQGISGLFTLAPWRYIAESAVLHGLQYIIPPEGLRIAGVLGGQDLNGPLWTLYWEARMYVLLALIGASAFLSQRIWFPAIALLLLLAAQAQSEVVSGYIWETHLWSQFLCGMLLFFIAANVKVNATHVLCALALIALNWTRSAALTPSGFTFFGIALVFGALALWIGSSRVPGCAHLRRNDYSFGVYIYHWPVLLMLRAALPPMSAPRLMVVTLIVLLPLAMLSWHAVEQPVLRRTRAWLASGARKRLLSDGIPDAVKT